jgi:hypothetical protein
MKQLKSGKKYEIINWYVNKTLIVCLIVGSPETVEHKWFYKANKILF